MRSRPPDLHGTRPAPVVARLPFDGTWIARNSPARRVPSHGTNLLGTRYAIDFVAVDDHRRTAPTRSWRTALATEPPEAFYGFGRPVLAPVTGLVAAIHHGEVDHAARRSQIALVPYMIGQGRRLRAGVGAVAGNHVIIRVPDTEAYVAVVHLEQGSVRVQVGQHVVEGQTLARCGNSGNSTQPHVHVQAMDSLDLARATGLPLAFRDFDERPSRHSASVRRAIGVPAEGAVVAPITT